MTRPAYLGIFVLLQLADSLSAAATQVPPLRTAEAGTTDRGSDLSGSSAEVTAAQSGSTVSIKVGKVRSRAQGLFTSWSMTASAPVSGKDLTNLATLDGLANSFTLGLKYQQMRAPGVLPTSDAHYHQVRKVICEEELPAAYSSATGAAWNPGSGAHNCDTATVQEYLPHRYLTYKSLFWDSSKWKLLWGLEGRVGLESFSFRMPGEEAEEVSRTPSSARAWVSVNPPRSSLLVTVGGEYQRTYKAGKAITVCPAPSAGETTVTCVTGAVTPPAALDKELLFIELRYSISSRFAASLQVTHDLNGATTGVDVPLYFFGDKSSLRGGVRLGWRDDEEEIKAGLFVGKAFTLFQ